VTPLRRVEGPAIALPRDNIDTDLIISAAHLKAVTRAGLGRFAFETLRRDAANPIDEGAGAPILVTGANFGCGSSREHAAWALADFGIRAIVAPSFSDIFAGNAYKNGLATVTLSRDEVEQLTGAASRGERIVVDLEMQTVTAGNSCFTFMLDEFRRECLLNGLDEIGLTLASEDKIAAFEARAA
jgi:3-isopropylmalate/(R)-2-methylmalate dehydratase small subunit